MSADPSGDVVARSSNEDRKTAAIPRAAIEFGARLRHFREAQGLTQEALARGAGLTAKFVSQIENGHTNPSIEVVTRLVEQGLELPMSAFFAACGAPRRPTLGCSPPRASSCESTKSTM